MDIISSIYEALTDEESFQALPERLAASAGARSSTIQVFSPDGPLSEMAVSHFTPEMFEFYVVSEMWRHDIWRVPTERRETVNSFTLVDEFVPPSVLQSSTFYNEFLRPFGDNTAHCIGGSLKLSGGSSAVIGLHRPLGAEPFSPADLQILAPLVPHLQRLFEVREVLRAAGRLNALSAAALDMNPNAVFVVDAAGKPLVMNRAAQVMVALGHDLSVTSTGLHAVHPAAIAALRIAVASACARSASTGGAVALPRLAQPALRLIVTPCQIGGITRALVVVSDPARIDRQLASKLMAIYRLTPAEAETAVALSRGLSPAEVAGQRKVSLATVRTQIRGVFGKMEVGGLPEMVAMVVTLPG
jgi:DNA-binding CsgD family transcriptional regulator